VLPVDDGQLMSSGHLDFVPVELVARTIAPLEPVHAASSPATLPVARNVPPLAAAVDERWAGRTSLFGEPEP